MRVSFEIFPPKTPDGSDALWQSIGQLEPLRPNFVSVTYGANGSDAERSHATVERLVGDDVADHRRPRDVRRSAAGDGRRRHHGATGRPACATSSPCAAIRRAASATGTSRIPTATATPPTWSPASSGSTTPRSRCRPIRRSTPRARPSTPTSTCSPPRSTPARRVRSRSSSSTTTTTSGMSTVSRDEASTSRSCRGSCRSRTSSRRAASPPSAARRCPTGWRLASPGSKHDPHTRQLVAANVATEQVLGLADAGVTDLHFYTMNRADLVYSICRLLDVHPVAQIRSPRTRRCRHEHQCAAPGRVGADPRSRRCDGHHDPGPRVRRGRVPRRPVRRVEPRRPRQQRPAQHHPAGRDPQHPLRATSEPVPTWCRRTRSRRPRSRRPTTA